MANPFKYRAEITRSDEGKILPPNYNTIRPITSSAERIDISDKKELDSLNKRRQADPWQTQAWQYSELIGEVRFSFNLIGNLMSRIRLYPGYITDEDLAPSDIQDVDDKGISDELKADARRALRLLSTGNGGISGLLRDAAINLFVAGECYLFQRKVKGAFGQESWEIRSVDEIQSKTSGRNQGLYVKGSRSASEDKWVKHEGTYLGRIWQSYPRYSEEADSSLRPILELMDELLMWNKAVRSAIKSQMNGGILYIPDEIANISEADGEDEDGNPVTEENSIEEDLLAAFTAPISDEGAATSIMPVILRGPQDVSDKIKHISLGKEVSKEMQDRADDVMDRILASLDIPKDVVSGLGSAKYCVDEKTEALTRKGWKKYTELTLDDQILTLNHETGLSEWQDVQAINIFDTENEIVYSSQMLGHSSVTTLNHRWPVLTRHKDGSKTREWETTSGLHRKHHVIKSAPHNNRQQPKYSDSFVELAAWYWTEGDVRPQFFDSSGRRGWLSIGQDGHANPDHVSRIISTLTDLYGPQTLPKTRAEAATAGAYNTKNGDTPRWYIDYSSTGAVKSFRLNHEAALPLLEVVKGKSKITSTDFIHDLTPAQLNLFIERSIDADGHRKKNSTCSSLGQRNPEALEAFELACILDGRAISRKVTVDSSGQDWHTVYLLHRQTSVIADVSKGTKEYTTHTGQVWCPTTENGTWFARREGSHYFTGNSNAMVIEETMYKSHVEPLALLIVDSLTHAFLHPVLKSYGYEDEEIERIVIWYDPSAIAAKPSKAEAAEKGFQNMTISGQAWRREHGFTESDAPTQLEVGQRLAMQRGLLDEQTSSALFNTLIPELFQKAREEQLANSPGADALGNALAGNPAPDSDPNQESADPNQMVPSPDNPENAIPPSPPTTAPTGLIDP